ncbi:TAT-binding protein-like protein 7, AAA ATPase [Coniosporium apollinis]|uniref:TAT-binding protein-like protein 7, AAA ATPase n=1 Tax=Coniosporium apollinis TaxID=61459 RepID=A0ABQ9NQF2_9PEZI|nr:TAT-binding protein-like protein 7, AAA ATPase [Coniosporium apollinis]
MSTRTKRRLDDFDPNKSDSDDLDYGASSPGPSKRSKHIKPQGRKPKKRQRRGYGDTDEEIEDDDDEISAESSASDSEEPEEPIEVNPRTGRSVRSATKKQIKYEEKSEDDIEDTGDDRAAVTRTPKRKPARKSLIVKLRMPQSSPRNMRARRGSRGLRQGVTPDLAATRRSSRISHDETEPMLALTDSGRHVNVVRPGTRSPEPQPPPRRPTRGSKGLKKPPSAIMEASQEASFPAEEIVMEQPESPEAAPSPVAEPQVEGSDDEAAAGSDTQVDAPGEAEEEEDAKMSEAVVQESIHEEDSDEGPIGRTTRSRAQRSQNQAAQSSQKRKGSGEDHSDFEPPNDEEEKEDEDMSGSDGSNGSPKKKGNKTDTSESIGGRRLRRVAGRTRGSQRSRQSPASDDLDSEIDRDELAEEAEELADDRAKRRRTRRSNHRETGIKYDDKPTLRSRSNKPDYRVYRPELVQTLDEDEAGPVESSQRKRGGGGGYRSLFSIQGPFGGAGGPPPLFGGPGGVAAAGGADSDSSDDDMQQRMPQGYGGTVGMTPTSAVRPLLPQTHNADPLQAGGTTSGVLGKVKDKKALADADPLGVDQNVNFEGVGGLEDHINQLKEMVLLPLLYPEVFHRFHVTPPRGVLFHGPPGTGKTLLARALASSVSSGGKKVTFYMRKGADALSKWVGEAERQLRLLFEEARKNQPSIIFFDEIDGLAPVRSSKQEQIHASIVATLLALMDGMDGRGQVIVIGATNRPDSVDPALRRPGRFDREFYFPLPGEKARRAIIDIHTKGWEPPLKPEFKDQLAALTKGYGGADLRALCTEAALNAVQGTYPQIYTSEKKLVIDPSKITVLAKDFMISVNKMIPSSERSGSSTSAPLTKSIEPLLRTSLQKLAAILDEVIPQKKKLTALEEAQYDDRDDDRGFERETMQRDFETARIFRPRLLIRGLQGMGQQYIGAALLNRFEGLHVQSFDLPTLLEDSARSPEAAVVQLFKEVRRHKPSVIYIPNVDIWYQTVAPSVIKTFTSMLRALPPNDPVLVLGILDTAKEDEKLDPDMLRDLFGFSVKNVFALKRPTEPARREYFESLIKYIRAAPTAFPDLDNRKKRKLPELEQAPEPEPMPPSKEDIKAQKQRDRYTLNLLKINLAPVMEQLKKYKRFRHPIIDESRIRYLFDEQDPQKLTTDLDEEQRQEQQLHRPFEMATDPKGVPGLLEVATGKFYYNLDINTIEKRLSNGYYKRHADFLFDVRRLAKDAATSGDEARTLNANELVNNVEVDMVHLKEGNPQLAADCEAVYLREKERERQAVEKAAKQAAEGHDVPLIATNVPPQVSGTTTETSGPIVLGVPVPGHQTLPPVTPRRLVGPSPLSNGYSNSVGGGHHTHQSNGSTIPSRIYEDVHMTDSQELGSVPHARVPVQIMATPSAPNTQATQRSQQYFHTQLAPGSHPGDYRNSASTTTSGQKTSDKSNRSSGPYNYNTQSTNGAGTGHHPDFTAMQQVSGGASELPDTQGTSSSKGTSAHGTSSSFGSTISDSIVEMVYQSSQSNSQPSQSSQPFPVPAPPHPAKHQAPSGPSAIQSLLNPEQPPLLVDETTMTLLHKQLVQRSSGLSVEQLEQVNAALMDAVWKMKGEWNRNLVAGAVTKAFNETMEDIEQMQKIQAPSQEKDEQ